MSEKKTTSSAALDRLIRPGSAGGGVRPGYTSFVKLMRVLLPLAALSIFGLLLAWPDMDSRIPQAMTPPADSVQAENVKNELINPRFEGMDDKQQPYTITATRATQSEEGDEIVALEEPVADIMLDSGHWLAAQASRGQYDQASNVLVLEEDVFLLYEDQYELETSKLSVDIEARRAWSDVAVAGKGIKGALNAANLRADLAENTLVFGGPARLVFHEEISGL
jgi:lipopolysaccharide export system protein LptC